MINLNRGVVLMKERNKTNQSVGHDPELNNAPHPLSFKKHPLLGLLYFSSFLHGAVATPQTASTAPENSGGVCQDNIDPFQINVNPLEFSVSGQGFFSIPQTEVNTVSQKEQSMKLKEQMETEQLIKSNIVFVPSSLGTKRKLKSKELIINNVVNVIMKGMNRSDHDRAVIDLVLNSDRFKIKIFWNHDQQKITFGANANYQAQDHSIYLMDEHFSTEQNFEHADIWENKLARTSIHEFNHASDSVQNGCSGEVKPFQSNSEFETLKKALDDGDKRVLKLQKLMKKANLTEEEKEQLRKYKEIATKYYSPKLQEIPVANTPGESLKKSFDETGTYMFETASPGNKKLTSEFHTRYIKKAPNGNGYLLYGFSIDIDKKDDYLKAYYRDSTTRFEENMKLLYSRIPDPKARDEVITTERYTHLRENHPEMTMLFYPEVVQYQKRREEAFQLKKTAEAPRLSL